MNNVVNAGPNGRLEAAAGGIVAVWLTATTAAHLWNPGVCIGLAALGMSALMWVLFRGLLEDLVRPTAFKIVLGLVAGAVMIAATYGLFPMVGHAVSGVPGATASLYRLMGVPRAIPVVLMILALIVIGEEILWRGVVQEAISARLGLHWAVIPGAVVYGLCHAPLGSPLLVAVAIACGIYWSLLRARTGSLIPSLISHLMWDVAILIHPLVGR